MTATTVVSAAQQHTGLEALADAVGQARRAVRAANDACDSAQPEYDEVTAKLRDLRRERKAAPDSGATVAQLRALDSQISEMARKLEVSDAALRRLAQAREAAEKAEREAQRHLVAAHRRAKDLPGIIQDIRVHLVHRRRELADAELVASQIRRHIDEYQTLASQLEAELGALEGRAE